MPTGADIGADTWIPRICTDGVRSNYRAGYYCIEATNSGEIMFATEAATMHELISVSRFVYPVVVVPAQLRPRR
jgi:hypothetical protein